MFTVVFVVIQPATCIRCVLIQNIYWVTPTTYLRLKYFTYVFNYLCVYLLCKNSVLLFWLCSIKFLVHRMRDTDMLWQDGCNLQYCMSFFHTRSGFYRSDWPSVETLAEDAADVLFRRVLRNGNHLFIHTVTRQEQSWLQSTSPATWSNSCI